MGVPLSPPPSPGGGGGGGYVAHNRARSKNFWLHSELVGGPFPKLNGVYANQETLQQHSAGYGCSCHAAVKKLFFYRFCMGRTSIVFRSKAIVWGVSLLCF